MHKGKLKKRKKGGKDKILNVAIKLVRKRKRVRGTLTSIRYQAKLDALTKEQIKEIMREVVELPYPHDYSILEGSTYEKSRPSQHRQTVWCGCGTRTFDACDGIGEEGIR